MAKYTSFDSFIKAHIGKAMDYDGVAGCQCFTKNHYILMEDYTYKAIQDIEVGDKVIGYDGKINNVIQKHKYKANNLVFARTKYNDIICTDDHPFYYKDGTFAPISAMNNKPPALFNFENYKESGLTNDELRFLGFWLGDGNLGRHENKSDEIRCTFNNKKLKYLETLNILSSYNPRKDSNDAYEGRISIVEHPLLAQHIYKCYNNKKEKILPLIYTNREYPYIIEGFCKADGSERNHSIVTSNTSKSLLLSLQAGAILCGYTTSSIRPIKRNTSMKMYIREVEVQNIKPIWCMTICQSGTHHNKELTSLEYINEEEVVYNIGTDGSHTYICDNYKVHNCVDLIKYYLDEVFDIKPGAWGDAHSYYDEWTTYTDKLQKNFTRIANTPDFVPKKGDIMVWGKTLNGSWGHIALCDGVGDTTYFYSYDNNWTGNHDATVRIKHNYNHVLGVLRPKDQTKVTGKTTTTNPTTTNPTTTGNVQKKVIDISQYQTNVNYAAAAKEIDGMIIRIGYRGWGSAGILTKDSQFDNHIKGAIDNKIPYGFYFFSQATNAAEAKAEADYAYSIIKSYKPTYPVYIDIEDSGAANSGGRADKNTKATWTAVCKAFCDRINELGLIGGVYTGEYWMNNKVDATQLKSYSIWCAKYGTNNGTAQTKPSIAVNYDGWQFTSVYKVSGFSNGIDMSYFYKDFTIINTAINKQNILKSSAEYQTYYVINENGVNYRETPNGLLKGTYNWATQIKIEKDSEIKKDNFTWVKTDKGYWIAKEFLSTTKPEIPFEINKNYILLVDLRVRTGPGVTYTQKKRSQLSVNGKNNSYNQTLAVLKKGTIITALAVKKNGNDYWIQFPSGWLCARQGTTDYVKKK